MSRAAAPRRIMDALAYPDELERAEAAAVIDRRRLAGVAGAPSPGGLLPDDTLGFGLSGGGVRSATFCLGLFQALAKTHSVRRIDFLATVSGGGYFGAFLGRLFTRDWVKGVADVERVLTSTDPEEADAADRAGWAVRVMHWLRENGRYLAPRGSGDVLLLGAILLRNWAAMQVVLVTFALTVFLGLQALRELADALGMPMPGAAATSLWWSPWLSLPLVPLLLVAVPSAWAYWLVSRERTRIAQWSPRIGVWGMLALSGAGALNYGAGLARGTGWHPVRFWTCAVVVAIAILALVFYVVAANAADPHARHEALTEAEADSLARLQLSKRLSASLQITGALLALALVDTLGQTLYAVLREGSLLKWSAAVVGAFAAVGSLARLIWMLLAPANARARAKVPESVASWVAAILVLGVWLVAVDVGSHAIRWEFRDPCGAPQGVMPASVPCHASAQQQMSSAVFLLVTTGVLAGFSFVFGQTRSFVNLSSAQGFYAARLTRAFLGASNPRRLGGDTQVSDAVKGDDVAGELYWTWPSRDGAGTRATARHPAHKGGPLHIVSTTVNETLNARSGLQNQDRKGTPLAVGPKGLSLGVRHHLVSGAGGWTVYPSGPSDYRVWDPNSRRAPEALSLGRWASISGAAFSAAAGASTTVPLAILLGMFNIRLGYWWDPGVSASQESWMERLLPVQAALLAEVFARTRGTAARLWNLSDGGHFENMGGYELIRRRVPVIVIVDAEADPDFMFQGLSDLVRKARLDFAAEIVFLDAHALDRITPSGVRPFFGDVDALRRGVSTSEAHAALARVTYGDADDPDASRSWLVYVKATLTGDEPEDVRHYHRRYPDFPHETAFDQFFDEAQWESYRQLGQHIGQRVLTPELFDHLRTVRA